MNARMARVTRALTVMMTLVMTLLFGASRVMAAQPNDTLVIPIDETLRVPGAILQPDTYTFALAGKSGTPDSVTIARASDKKVMTTAKITPVKRDSVTDPEGLAIEIALTGDNDDEAPALKGWLDTSTGTGYEFVFDGAEGRRIERSGPPEIIPIAPTGATRPGTDQRGDSGFGIRGSGWRRSSDVHEQLPTPNSQLPTPKSQLPNSGSVSALDRELITAMHERRVPSGWRREGAHGSSDERIPSPESRIA